VIGRCHQPGQLRHWLRLPRQFEITQVIEKAAEDRAGLFLFDRARHVGQQGAAASQPARIRVHPQKLNHLGRAVLQNRLIQQAAQVFAGRPTQAATGAIVVGAAVEIVRAAAEERHIDARNIRTARYHPLQSPVGQLHIRHLGQLSWSNPRQDLQHAFDLRHRAPPLANFAKMRQS
jgi:hypothetical protein